VDLVVQLGPRIDCRGWFNVGRHWEGWGSGLGSGDFAVELFDAAFVKQNFYELSI
jgi:hypothetical protein